MGRRANFVNGARNRVGSARLPPKRIGSARSVDGHSKPSIIIARPSSAPVSSRPLSSTYKSLSVGKKQKTVESDDTVNTLKVEGTAIPSLSCQASKSTTRGLLRGFSSYQSPHVNQRRKNFQEHSHSGRRVHIPYLFIEGNERHPRTGVCRSFGLQEQIENGNLMSQWDANYCPNQPRYSVSDTSENDDPGFAESPDSANIPALHFQESISSEEHELYKSPTSSRNSSGKRSPICLVSKSSYRNGETNRSMSNRCSNIDAFSKEKLNSRSIDAINIDRLLKMSETDSNDDASESTIVSLGQKIKQLANRKEEAIKIDSNNLVSDNDDNFLEDRNWDDEWKHLLHSNHNLILKNGQMDSSISSEIENKEESIEDQNINEEKEGQKSFFDRSLKQNEILPSHDFQTNENLLSSQPIANSKQICLLEDIEEEDNVSSEEDSFESVREKNFEFIIENKKDDESICEDCIEPENISKTTNIENIPTKLVKEESIPISTAQETYSLNMSTMLPTDKSFRLSADLQIEDQMAVSLESKDLDFSQKLSQNQSTVPVTIKNSSTFSKTSISNGNDQLPNSFSGSKISSLGVFKPFIPTYPNTCNSLIAPKMFFPSKKFNQNSSSDLTLAIQLIENEEMKDNTRFKEEEGAKPIYNINKKKTTNPKSEPQSSTIKESEELDLNILSEKILIFAEEIQILLSKKSEQKNPDSKEEESLQRILKSEQILEQICFQSKKKLEPKDKPDLHKECNDRLSKKQRELEDRIQKNLDLIRKLLDDKKELTEKCEKISTEVNNNERRHLDKIKLLESKHAVEIKNVKERITNAEETRREKWAQQKTKMIKDSSFRSLETKMKDLITQHREELNKLKENHWTQQREAEEKWIQKFRDLEEHWKDKTEKEKQEYAERERSRDKERHDHELHQSELVWQGRLENLQKQYERTKLEKEEDNQRTLSRIKTEHEDQLRLLRREIELTKDEYEEKIRTTLRDHETEISNIRKQNEKTQKEWRDEIAKDYENIKIKSEKELRERLRRQRDKEIEKAIKEIQQETNLHIEDNKKATDNKMKNIRERYETEMTELENSERISRTRYLEMKGALVQKEEEIVYLRARLHTQSLELTDFQQMFQMQH